MSKKEKQKAAPQGEQEASVQEEGMLGRGCDYLFGIVAEFEALGIHDRSLTRIAAEVRARQEMMAGS